MLRAREQLTRLMGLWGADAGYTVPARLPELPTSDPPLDHLESLAIGQRSDLAAMRKEVEELGHVSSLARSTRWTGSVTVGLEATRLVHGNYSFGPNAAIQLPLFDQRQALIARLDALLRQSEARLQARAVVARSEVRTARDAMVAARRVAERYRTVIVPLRERIVALAQQHYDAMLMGAYELLLAKQSEVTAYRDGRAYQFHAPASVLRQRSEKRDSLGRDWQRTNFCSRPRGRRSVALGGRIRQHP